jgi:hypothetical protein
VRELTIDAPMAHWKGGFQQLHPVVHLPSNHAENVQVEIWLQLPDAGEITEVDGLLSWPPGTTADRVEYRGSGADRRVVDVRGATRDADGAMWDHLYRPSGTTPDAPLYGVAWPTEDTAARKRAVERLIARLLPSTESWTDARRDKWSGALRRKSNCTGCHVPRRPANTSPNEHGLTNRGTDALGWFTPASIFEDALPVESYGTYDRNTSEWHTVRCGDAPATRSGAKWTCAEGVPVAHFDLAAARAADDPFAVAICQGREMLLARMSPDAREKRSSSTQACDR